MNTSDDVPSVNDVNPVDAARPDDTVGAAGERAVLATVRAQLRAGRAVRIGPGDDAAVLRHAGDTVITTDTMIEGPDFRLDWHTGWELGWKLVAVNLSDVAAMGARPTALTLALACPPVTPVALLRDIARGAQRAVDALAPGCAIAGGDLATAPVVLGAVTAVGELDGQAPVLRSGARAQDTVAYAGDLGLSGLGLELLRSASEDRAANAAETVTADGLRGRLTGLRAAHPAALRAHLTPDPPVALGRAAAAAGAHAMLDVSDGLALDAERIARASGVVIDLCGESLRCGFGAQTGWRRTGGEPERVSLRHMLAGGEDHGLLATFAAGAELPPGFVAIGSVRAVDTGAGTAAAAPAVTCDGEPVRVRGWDALAH